MDISSLAQDYRKQIRVGSLGGHSALDICHGAKRYGFPTLVVAQRGREKTYNSYYRTRSPILPISSADGSSVSSVGCVDEVLTVDAFRDVLTASFQEQLRALHTIMVQSRYFWVYMDDPLRIEQQFCVPFFGSRFLLKLEDRSLPYNQYHLLQDAGIPVPLRFESAKDIDRPVLIKASEGARSYERGFFLVSSFREYEDVGTQLERDGNIASDWRSAPIEEFVIGAPVNFNFFFSPLTGEIELLGTDTRRQTNLDGFLRLTAEQQQCARAFVDVRMIETGHIACTVKESHLEQAFALAESFVRATQNLSPIIDPSESGIIGPFALQGAIVTRGAREELVIFDVSFRIPGSPGTRFTPYSGYLYGRSLSCGERIAMELRQAIDSGRLAEVVT